MRRLTHSRMERLERTLGPARTGPPPCAGCGASDTEIVRLVILDVDESIEHCAVCERAYRLSVGGFSSTTDSAIVTFSACVDDESLLLQIDAVSACWTATDVTSSYFIPDSRACIICASCDAPLDPSYIPSSATGDHLDVCEYSSNDSSDTPEPQPRRLILTILTQWGTCDGCSGDVWPPRAPDGVVDLDDVMHALGAVHDG
jgi:hypothetical protein